MSKLRVHRFSFSLDGCGAGPDQDLANRSVGASTRRLTWLARRSILGFDGWRSPEFARKNSGAILQMSLWVGVGLLASLACGAFAQTKLTASPEARVILHQAARVAENIADDPPKPAEILRISYLDPLYGPEKRENTLLAIAKAEAKALDFEGIAQISKAVGNGKARDSIMDVYVIARFTTGDPQHALKADYIPEGRKQSLLYQLALSRAQAGDAAGALIFARAVTAESEKEGLLSEIAAAQAKLGDLHGALQTAGSISATNMVATETALLAIAVAQAKAGDRTGATKTFEQLNALVRADSSLKHDPSPLGLLARAETEAGQFKEALETARSIPFDVPRNVVLAKIAGSQAKAGDAQGAFQTTQAIRGTDSEYWKSLALARIAKAQASHGDRNAAGETFQSALRRAESISIGYFRGARLATIAKTQAQSGERTPSVATFDKALAMACRMPDPPAGTVNYEDYSKDMLLYLIAKAQAEAGFAKSALKTAGEIRVVPDRSRERGWEGGNPRVMALHEIARAQGLRVAPHEAVVWAELLPAPVEKAYALLGLAEGLLERTRADSAEPTPDDDI